jgi:hypothetical protein
VALDLHLRLMYLQVFVLVVVALDLLFKNEDIYLYYTFFTEKWDTFK